MRVLTTFLIYLLYALAVEATPAQSTSAKFIPSETEYYPFLLSGWDASRPTVIVFKDPYCPYCIKAIPKLPELNGYNVFLFWAPILGASSLKRVDDIFHCKNPASDQVLRAVYTRKNPQCELPLNHRLLTLNQAVVDNYQINSVPRFYLQGQSVSFAMLKQLQKKRPPINGVKVNWQRFNLMQFATRQNSHVLSLLVPLSHQNDLELLVNKYKPEFLFLEHELLEHKPQYMSCISDPQTCLIQNSKKYSQRIEEFKLLFGDSLPEGKLVIIDHNGQVLTI